MQQVAQGAGAVSGAGARGAVPMAGHNAAVLLLLLLLLLLFKLRTCRD